MGKSPRVTSPSFAFGLLLVILSMACHSPSSPDAPTTALTPCTFSPAAGIQTSNFTLTIANDDPDASIWYTLDGSTPQAGSSPLYSSGLDVKYTSTVKAIASKSGMQNSAVSSATYHFLWKSRTSMPIGRSEGCAASIGNLVYVIGGKDQSGTISAQTLVFDTVADSWSTEADMLVASYGASAVSYGGKVYVFGGYGTSGPLSTIYCFDPSGSPRWTLAGYLSGTRFRSSGALLGGVAYLVGGDSGSGSMSTTEEIDLTQYSISGTASTIDALAMAVREPIVIGVGGYIYSFGGDIWPTDVPRLDPGQSSGSQWSTITTSPALDQFKRGSGGVVGSVAYVIGGYQNSFPYALSTCRAFNPATSTITAMTAMTTARYFTASATVNGTILVFGGNTDTTTVTNAVEQYDPAAE